MEEQKKYVVYGMRLKCSDGSMENYISTDVGHGVVYQGQPVLNANDHDKDINLTHFGDCHAKRIYEDAKKQIDEKLAAKKGDSLFMKGLKWAAKTEAKLVVSVKEHLTFHKCELDTPLPWMFASEDHMIDGAPALLEESQCACRYGGIITIVPIVEEAEEEVLEEEQPDISRLAQCLSAIHAISMGTLSLTEGVLSLMWENMEASARNMIHQLLYPLNDSKGLWHAGLSLMPSGTANQIGQYMATEDIKAVDRLISDYENQIYEKYEDLFLTYQPLKDMEKKLKNEIELADGLKKQELQEQLATVLEQQEVLFSETEIMSEMTAMGDQINSMAAVAAYKNDLVNFVNLVNTNNPLDLKSRAFVDLQTEDEKNYSIWSAPWAKPDGGTFEQDYAGNWLYGYVGAEYFATPADDEVLKYGAGLAQLLSDITNNSDPKNAALKYINSLNSGEFGDNAADAEMIQEGIEAYRENKR